MSAVYIFVSVLGTAPPVLWNDWGYALEYSTFLVMPVTAGIAAWATAQQQVADVGDLLSATPRPILHRLAQTVWTVAGWALLGYLGAALTLGMWIGISASWGRPQVEVLVASVAAVALAAALGAASGAIAKTTAAAPVAAVGTWALTGMAAGSPIGDLAPITFGEPGVFATLHPGLALGRTVWLGSLAVLTVIFAARWLSQLRPTRREWLVTWLSAGAAAAAGVALVVVPIPRIGVALPERYVCKGDPVEVCVHPAWEGLEERVAATVNTMVVPLRSQLGTPERVLHSPSVGDASLDPLPLAYSPGAKGYSDDGLALWLAGLLTGSYCDRLHIDPDPVVLAAEWMLIQAGFEVVFSDVYGGNSSGQRISAAEAQEYLAELWRSGELDCAVAKRFSEEMVSP
ncbi:MAG: hypothetical protein ACE5F5_03070 [Acidimicrobiia bacterium]